MLYRNGYGHFSDAGDEYVIERPDTPAPWVNVISNGEWGLTLSNAGGGYSWYRNANLSRRFDDVSSIGVPKTPQSPEFPRSFYRTGRGAPSGVRLLPGSP